MEPVLMPRSVASEIAAHRRLVIGSIWPIVLLFVAGANLVVWELARDRWKHNPTLVAPRGFFAAVSAGLERALPLTLVVTFLLVPSTATRIFKSFLCDPFEFDGGIADGANTTITKRYLHDDLALSCDDEAHTGTRNTAIVMIGLWPVGVPLLYALLLWKSRDALRTNVPTSLSRATAFLWADYSTAAYWWEPLEMCRKLTLTGWVLLIGEEFEQARILVALIVSTTFLA
eukprot:6247698-Prymnesium_polylepis.1